MEERIIIIAVAAFIISTLLCPLFIAYSRRAQFQQQVREDGPQSHMVKKGTPTMGGLVFLAGALISLIIFARPFTWFLGLALLVTLWSAFIGWLDDYAKVSHSRSLGLKARNKLLGQLLLTLIFVFILDTMGHSTEVFIPFTDMSVETGMLYPVLVFLMITGSTNAVNLTDGIDGLAAGSSIIALMAFLVLSTTTQSGDLAYFCAALVGAVFGFLIFNLHPARLFMGDVGSLALGGALAGIAVLTKAELALVVIGGLFILETVSVMLQVLFFKLTGRRIFLMSPLHHHLELKGWSEWQVVTFLWALAFLFAVVGLIEVTGGWF